MNQEMSILIGNLGNWVISIHLKTLKTVVESGKALGNLRVDSKVLRSGFQKEVGKQQKPTDSSLCHCKPSSTFDLDVDNCFCSVPSIVKMQGKFCSFYLLGCTKNFIPRITVYVSVSFMVALIPFRKKRTLLNLFLWQGQELWIKAEPSSILWGEG